MKVNLEELRKAKNLTSKELADDIGVSSTTISRLEKGYDHKTNLAVAELVADYLGKKVSDVFDSNELTSLGRGPGTRAASSQSDQDVLERRGVCDRCHMVKPKSGVCNCGE